MTDTGLIAGDAGANIVGPALLRLAGHFRIANHGPCHAAHVRLTFGNNTLGILGLVDTAGDENRRSGGLLQLSCIGSEIGVAHSHRRRNVHRAGRGRRRSRDHIEVVDLTFQEAGGRERLVFGQPGGVIFLARETQSDDEVAGHRTANGSEGIDHEAGTVLQASSIPVGAAVDARVQKLRRKVAMACDELDTISAGLGHPPRCGAVTSNDLVDQIGTERSRHGSKSFRGSARRCIRSLSYTFRSADQFASGMKQLDHRPGAMRLNGAYEITEFRDA